jgi:hypothetical protein
MEKELENPEKREIGKQPSRPTKPSQAARPCRLTGGPRLSAAVFLSHALSLSLAAQWGQPVGASFLRLFALSFSVSRARFASAESLPPRVPFTLSALWTLPIRSAFSTHTVDRRMRTHARRRISRP